MFFFSLKNSDVCSFADDTTPYVCNERNDRVLRLLEENIELALCCFESNYMKLYDTDKCHLIVSGYKHEKVWTQVRGDKIWERVDVKRLEVTIDRELKFDQCNHDLL